MSINEPQRRYMFTAVLGADDKDDLRAALHHILYELDTHDDTMQITSGGYSWGGHYELKFNADTTHDSYFAEVDAYLEAKKSKPTEDAP